jgi:hypothetical protein
MNTEGKKANDMATGQNIDLLEQIILSMEDRTGDVPEWLDSVETWKGYIDAEGAQQLLNFNVKPQAGKVGTNRPQVTGAIPQLIEDILGANWKFNHQGIAFNDRGDLIDGQHRLEAIVRADKIEPGIQVPLMISWNLPVESNEKIDLARRRNTGTYLAMEGYTSTSRLNTTLKLIWLYETTDFDRPPVGAHWNQIPNLDIIRNTLRDHPLAVDGCLIGGQLANMLTASAASAAWVICREKYPEAMNMEFVEGIKKGANLAEGDPRLALRNWSANRKETGKRAIPYLHMAIYFKAFKAFREGRSLDQVTFKPSVERFPRP